MCSFESPSFQGREKVSSILKEFKRGAIVLLAGHFMTSGCGYEVGQMTPETQMALREKIRSHLTDKVLDKAGISANEIEPVLNELVHMGREGMFAPNRRMINEGVKVFYRGDWAKFNAKSVSHELSLEDQHKAVENGLKAFSELTGLSVVMVTNEYDANAVLEGSVEDRTELGSKNAICGITKMSSGFLQADQTGKELHFKNLTLQKDLVDFSGIKDPDVQSEAQKAFARLALMKLTEEIVEHELGHNFGYWTHSENPKNLMYPVASLEYHIAKAGEAANFSAQSCKDLVVEVSTGKDFVGQKAFRATTILVKEGLL